MSEFRGPWANTERSPLIAQTCRCPLMCPTHGENGAIPGDMSHPSQPWGIGFPESTAGYTSTESVDPEELEMMRSTISKNKVWVTPASIIPIEISNAPELLKENNLEVQGKGEEIVVTLGETKIVFSYEIANALCQEILKARKRIELTLPETLDTTLEAMKARLGSDMAPLVDLLREVIENNKNK